MNRQFVALLLCCVFCASSSGFAQQSSDVVATVGEKKIYRKELLPERTYFVRQREALSADELKKWLLDYTARKLRDIVVRELFETSDDAVQLEVQEEEIDRFVKGSLEVEHREIAEARARVQALSQKLESGALGDAERELVQKQLEDGKRLIAISEESRQFAEEHPEQQQQLQREIAELVVTNWKMNRALFGRYGGRVILQQSGAEPLDAYRMFLRDAQSRRLFTIEDRRLKRAFWRYFVDDKRHIFLPGEDGSHAIARPWWVAEGQTVEQQQVD